MVDSTAEFADIPRPWLWAQWIMTVNPGMRFESKFRVWLNARLIVGRYRLSSGTRPQEEKPGSNIAPAYLGLA